MQRETFEQLVSDAFEALPEQFRELVDNVAFLVEDEPSKEVRKEQGLGRGQTLFGLYIGIPRTGRNESYGVGGTLPDTITIYQTPIEEAADGDADAIKDMVYETVWHEIAHHFGLEEDAVRLQEHRRRNRKKDS